MNDLRTAAQQALEALEQSETTVPYEGFGMSRRVAERKHQAAITALRAALAQQAEPVKPVAWLRKSELEDLLTCNYRHLGADSPKIWAPYDISSPSPDMELVPVYTAPPQRKPLTDEDILRVLMLDPPNPSLWPHLKGEAIVGDVQQAVLAIVRAVERAHRIPMPETPRCTDCWGIGYDASGQLCACQQNPSFG